uniref:Ig-like domain-containing protein n=1 Tax=Oryzias sinensis TaxID=183150 RepID=A0A8C7X583_9TELE
MKTCLLNYLLCIKCSTKLKLCFYLSSGSSKVVCSPWTVQAHLGQDVVLSCRVEPPINLTAETLEWKHGPAFVHVYRSGGDNYDDQDLRFKNRTILNHQNLKDGNISLTLTNVTKEDEGNYTFCLRNHDISANVTLTVGKLRTVTHATFQVRTTPFSDTFLVKQEVELLGRTVRKEDCIANSG